MINQVYKEACTGSRYLCQRPLTIFALIVQNGLAFEVNTKSMFKWHNAALYDLVIPWYQAAGGRLFTIGSDAHEKQSYRNHFAEAVALLQDHHVDQIATYTQHQPTMVAI